MDIEGKNIRERIINNVSEGVMLISFEGTINYINPAGLTILGLKKEQVVDKKVATVFFDNPQNIEFVQTLIEAAYDQKKTHSSIIPYCKKDAIHPFRVVTSYLTGEDGSYVGVIIVFSDLSEQAELKDALKSMEKIKKLNEQLELRNKLISETFGRFLSDDIVDNLLNSPDGIQPGGNKKELTMLMSDLRGFTAMSERMDAEDLISMLNHYLGEMTEVIQKYNGTIIEFIGDGILAIFGAPVWTKKHAENAVAAALEMQSRMVSVNAWNEKKHYPVLAMGIGLNTGEVIVGNLGSEKRMKYGVVGSNVNLCGRIESYTVGGQVLISPSTRKKIKAKLDIEKEMTVYPKGANGEIVLSHITGIGDPYNIYAEMKDDIMQTLEVPIPVRFRMIEEKHGKEKIYYGGISAESRSGAILDTNLVLEIYDNIQIDAGGKLFCKVMEKLESGYKLLFTSIPSGYAVWLRTSRLDKV
ncbi:MAG: PAS domain S-box protein [Lachnospiraceae bacterium]|nr:PAS domain S-box protein [Lachnospiraceae bacterium]